MAPIVCNQTDITKLIASVFVSFRSRWLEETYHTSYTISSGKAVKISQLIIWIGRSKYWLRKILDFFSYNGESYLYFQKYIYTFIYLG